MAKRTTAEKGTLVTALFCGNAEGYLIPPFFIFKKGPKQTNFMNGAPSGSETYLGGSGWMTTEGFLQWLCFFIGKVRPTAEEPVLLLVDGHASHKNIEVVELAKNNHIQMLSFPPHCTHKMQPLDRTLMKPFKTAFNKAAEEFIRQNGGSKILLQDISSLVAKSLVEIDKDRKTKKNGENVIPEY